MKRMIGFSILAAVTIFFSGCGGGGCGGSCAPNTSKNPTDTGGIVVPVDNLDKRRFICIDKMMIDDKEYAATCKKLIVEDGETLNNGEIYGLLKDFDDKPLYKNDQPYICKDAENVVGEGVTFSSILQKNNRLYFISQFDCAIGAIYLAEVDQFADGNIVLKEDSMRFVSQRDEFGGYRHQSGSVTPWQSYLGSEGYEPDARVVEGIMSGYDSTAYEYIKDKFYEETALYWKGDLKRSNPYFYGWANETIIDANGVEHFRKHYSMGRFSHFTEIVMPDRRTVYLTDNRANGALFMFVADKKEDLSVGTLYAPKEFIVKDVNSTYMKFDWINLGHTSNRKVKLEVAKKLNFSDLFDVSAVSSDLECLEDYTLVSANGESECLKIKNSVVNETILSRLETKRYAAMRGADFNFIRPRGLAYDNQRNRIYVAAAGYANALFENNYCGSIFAIDLTDTKIDTDGNLIKSNFVADKIYTILSGKEQSYEEGSPYAGNECSINAIADPEELSYLEDKDILTISESGRKHVNPMVWNYDLKNNRLIRVMSFPIGSHPVSINWRRNIKGYDYLIYGVQHPLKGEKDVILEDTNSYIGYWGPVQIIKNTIK